MIVGIDGSGEALSALRWAIGWADRTGQRIELRTVCSGDRTTDEDALAVLHGSARAAGIGDRPGVNFSLIEDTPDEGLTDVDGRATLVLGTRNHGKFGSVMHRSVSARCAATAVAPVIVVPSHAAAPTSEPMRIMVGVDGGMSSVAALRFADTHRRLDDPLAAVHYWQRTGPRSAEGRDREEQSARHLVSNALETAGLRDVGIRQLVRESEPHHGFADIEGEIDLLVLGQRPTSAWSRMVHGSVASHVVKHLIVPTAFVPMH